MMKERDITKEIRDFLAGQTISIMGVAQARQLPEVPEEFSPQFSNPDAQSVICYAVPIPRGVIHAEHHDLSLYWRYCTMLYKSLDMASNALSLFLEERGHVTTPLYGCYPMKIVKREYWGLVPLVYWAQAAGLGRLTKCGLLAHPEYGTRMIMGGVSTTAQLPPTETIKGDVCPENCFACIDQCPAHAIDRSGKVDHERCMRHANASPPLAFMVRDKSFREQFSIETLVNTIAVDEHATYSCIECLKVCPLNR